MNIGLRKLAITVTIGTTLMLSCTNDRDEHQEGIGEESRDGSTAEEADRDAASVVSLGDAGSEQEPSHNVNDAHNEHPDGQSDADTNSVDSQPPTNDPDGSSSHAGNSSAEQLPYDTRVILGVEKIPAPFIADLVTRSDLREVLGYRGELHETNLAGRPMSPSYQAVRFAPEDGAFGFAVELWRLDNGRETAKMVREMSDSWFSVGDATPLRNAALGASMGIRTLLLASPQTSFVLGLSCGENFCTREQLLAMGTIAKSRLETDAR